MTLFPQLERQLTDAADRLPAVDAAPARISAREPAPRRARRRLGAAAALSVAAAAAVCAVLLTDSASVEPALAAKTYAAVDPGASMIHFVFDVRSRRNGRVVDHVRTERWQLGKLSRTRTTRFSKGKKLVSESDTNSMVTRLYDVAANHQFVSRLAPGTVVSTADPFTTFRKRYRAGAVKDIGPGVIGNQPARLLRVKAGPRTITYFVGPQNGTPIAIRVFQIPRSYTVQTDGKRGPTTAGTGTVSRLTRVLTYERLRPTTTNRRLLRAPIPNGVKIITAKTP